MRLDLPRMFAFRQWRRDFDLPRRVLQGWLSYPLPAALGALVDAAETIVAQSLIRRLRAHPQLVRYLHRPHALLKQLRGLQPAPSPAAPALRPASHQHRGISYVPA